MSRVVDGEDLNAATKSGGRQVEEPSFNQINVTDYMEDTGGKQHGSGREIKKPRGICTLSG